MSRSLRGRLVCVALGLSAMVVGCAEDNEKTANITGNAPANAPKTQAEAYNQMKNSGLQSNYPGVNKKSAAPKPAAEAPKADATPKK